MYYGQENRVSQTDIVNNALVNYFEQPESKSINLRLAEIEKRLTLLEDKTL